MRNTFNDQNKQELNRFVQDATKECNYIVDQAVHSDDQTVLEPNFGVVEPNVWKEEFSIEFLDAKRSPQIFRAFYVPFYSRSKCTFNNYTLYKNVGPNLIEEDFINTGKSKHTSNQRPGKRVSH